MIWALVWSTVAWSACADRTFYTAAVFEHHRVGGWKDSRSDTVRGNLHFYDRAATIAKSKGADILIFPEYGLIPDDNRTELAHYAEIVPDIKRSYVNPCKNPDTFESRPILHNLSCFAMKNAMVIVGNMIEVQDCKGKPDCRDDGIFLFNTNLVFDRNGTLILKYHKEHLFLEDVDPPRNVQFPIFETDFGRFATFICFDIQFKRMGEVAEQYKVDAVAYPTKWDEEPPQLTSLQVQESWSVEHNITLLAADTNIPSAASVGSGIYNGRSGTLLYTYNPDGISKLLVARVPKRGQRLTHPQSSITAITAHRNWTFTTDGRDVKAQCSQLLLSPDNTEDFRCYSENITSYTFVPLTEHSGSVSACNNGMCCLLSYETTELKNRYYLGAFNGTQDSFHSSGWWEENCVLTICDSYKNESCVIFPRKSQTTFKFISLKSIFTSDDVYPSVVDSGMRLVPHHEWSSEICGGSENEKCLKFSSGTGRNIIALGMKGRAYARDPKPSNIGPKYLVSYPIILILSAFSSMYYVLLFSYMSSRII